MSTKLGEMDPEFLKLMQVLPPKPDLSTITKCRVLAEKAVKTAVEVKTTCPDSISIADRQIPTRDGSQITIRIYSPKVVPPGGSPLFIFFHSSGWCVGCIENDDDFFKLVCPKYGCVIVTVDYRLAPEHPFPTGHNDAEDALKWVAANATSVLKATPSKGFIVGGSSAGANIAAGLSHIARDELLDPPITGVWLNVPALVTPEALPERFKPEYLSYDELKNSRIIDRVTMELFKSAHKPDPMSTLMNPLIYPTGHKGLPPTYFQVCGMDPLRDEAFLYEKLLRVEEGIKTRMDVYPGLPHCFWLYFPMHSASKRALTDGAAGFEWLLQQTKSDKVSVRL